MRHLIWSCLSLSVVSLACSGASGSNLLGPGGDGGGGGSDSGATTPDGGYASVDAGADARSSVVVDAGGAPIVSVYVDSVQTPIASTGSSQETPVDQRVGILGLSLLKSFNDPSPLVVFSRTTPIDTPYNAGSTTLVGEAPVSALTPGSYGLVMVQVAYVKFTVAGDYHYDGQAVSGDFTDTIALTTGVSLAGAVRDRGWWSSSFAIGGVGQGTTTGENGDIAQPGAMSHIGLDLSGAVAAYIFSADITIPPTITTNMTATFTVNTYQDFHWQDQSDPGYTTGVFDVSSTGFEPVTQLGANSFTFAFAPAP